MKINGSSLLFIFVPRANDARQAIWPPSVEQYVHIAPLEIGSQQRLFDEGV